MVTRADIDDMIDRMGDTERSGSPECDCENCRKLKGETQARLLVMLVELRSETFRK